MEASTTIQVPALVDCHVHFRQPGLEHKADMLSESKAARVGGVSCVCDMPNTKPPTQTVQAFQDKVALYHSTGADKYCDMRFFFGATQHEHVEELRRLWTDPSLVDYKRRCSGLKLYLDNSTGNMKSSTEVTRAAFQLCGELDIPLVTHCEHAPTNDAAAEQTPYTDASSHSVRRPAESEMQSVADAIAMAVEFNTPLHIAHMSTAGALTHVQNARRDHPSLRLTCEVTPHHLFCSTRNFNGCGCGCASEHGGSKLKVNPPIRHVEDRNALWRGVLDGSVDCVGTDHAPHLISEKMNPNDPPSGIPSIELVVPLLLTVCAHRWPTFSTETEEEAMAVPPALVEGKQLTVEDVVRLMHTNPNRIFRLGLSEEKTTTLQLGNDFKWTVKDEELQTKCKWSPYNGWTLSGKASLPAVDEKQE